MIALPALLATSPAQADGTSSARPYVGASLDGEYGVPFFGYGLATVGGEVFTGVHLSPRYSVEWLHAFRFPMNAYQEPTEGEQCSGLVQDTWRWHVTGLRFWFHAVRTEQFDLAIGPSLGLGWMTETRRSMLTPGTTEYDLCYFPPSTTRKVAFAGRPLELAAEVRPTDWLGVRASFQASLAFGPGLFSVGGGFGPVVHF